MPYEDREFIIVVALFTAFCFYSIYVYINLHFMRVYELPQWGLGWMPCRKHILAYFEGQRTLFVAPCVSRT